MKLRQPAQACLCGACIPALQQRWSFFYQSHKMNGTKQLNEQVLMLTGCVTNLLNQYWDHFRLGKIQRNLKNSCPDTMKQSYCSIIRCLDIK